MSGIKPGLPTTSGALDQFLRNSYDVIQSVHQNLASIRAVADHLTPVEDLVEFQAEVTALHARLGLLVYAAELMERATDAGIDMLIAPDAPAQRALLNLRSAALLDAEHFATAAQFSALSAELAVLEQTLTGVMEELTTKVSHTELAEALAPLLDRLGGVEAGLGDVDGIIAGHLTQLSSEFTVALSTALATMDGNFAAHATALSQLQVRAQQTDDAVTSMATQVTQLGAGVTNLLTGQAATSSALSALTTRADYTEAAITSQSEALTQVNAQIVDTRQQVMLTGTAVNSLETRAHSSEVAQSILSSDLSQVSARLLDAETGISAQAEAQNELTSRVDATEDSLVVASEDRTTLRASLSGSGNHLPNSGYSSGLRHWYLSGRGDGWLTGEMVRNAPPTVGELPEGMYALSVILGEVPAGDAKVHCLAVPVEDLSTYLLSGYLAAENCTVRLEWRLLDKHNNEVGFGVAGEVTNKAPAARLSEWTRVFAPVPVPFDAVALRVELHIVDCNTAPPKAWLLRPQLETRVGAQIYPSPWVAGVTGIEEAMAEATQLLETRVTQAEDTVEAVSQFVTDLSASLGSVGEWRIVHHSGSGDHTSVGSPRVAGLYRAGKEEPEHALQRGLTLVQFGEDGNIESAVRFDVSASATERNLLAAALEALTPHDPFVLVSQDHHGIKQENLVAAINAVGGFSYPSIPGSRPYILLGRGEAGRGGGKEIAPPSHVPWQDYPLTLVNNTPRGLGENPGILEAVASQATAIEQMVAQVTQHGEDISTLSSANTALEGQITSVSGAMDVLGQAQTSLTVRVENTEAGLLSSSEDITELHSELAGAVTDLTAAQLAERAARQAAMQAATERINTILSDSILSAAEKPQLIIDYQTLIEELPGILHEATESDAAALGNDYSATLSDLTTYLNTLTHPTRWDDTSGDTHIT